MIEKNSRQYYLILTSIRWSQVEMIDTPAGKWDSR